jgi:pimeloyl-ACP methyl ester carboxylesterase
MESRLFLPGWGAPGTLYAPALPATWQALEPPAFAATGGSLAAYRGWLGRELRRRGRSALAGHSMGGALAILAAADTPELVDRLVLIGPAGLPLDKPIRASVRDFVGQLVRGEYPRQIAATAALAIARAPLSALRLAEHVRSLDLRRECARVHAAGVPAVVIGCATDTLVTTDRSRELARSLGARYEELDLRGGHMWMLGDRRRFTELVAALG